MLLCGFLLRFAHNSLKEYAFNERIVVKLKGGVKGYEKTLVIIGVARTSF